MHPYDYGLGHCSLHGRLTTFLAEGLWVDYNTFLYRTCYLVLF